MPRTLTAVILGFFVLAAPSRAQEGFKPDKGFRSLFNGKDLTGWVYRNTKENLDGKTASKDKRFFVQDGAIVCDVGKGIKDLYTAEKFDRDFVVKMEFRAGLKADSGVYIRGPQLQIRDFQRRGEHKYLKGFKNDDWNLLVITVKGTEATFTLNGEQLKNPDKMKIPATGGIGLQAETGKFEYRHLQIKTAADAKPGTRANPLFPDETAYVSAAAQTGALKQHVIGG